MAWRYALLRFITAPIVVEVVVGGPRSALPRPPRCGGNSRDYSLTVTPMISAKLLKSTPSKRFATLLQMSERPFTLMLTAYERTLGIALRRRRLVLGITAGTLALTTLLYLVMPKGFLPAQDTGVMIAMLDAAPDASFREVSRLQAQATETFLKDPDVRAVTSVAGIGPLNPTSNSARLTIVLKDRDQRDASAEEIAVRLTRQAAAVPGVTLYVEPVQDIQISTRASRSQYQYTLSASDSTAETSVPATKPSCTAAVT